MSRLDDLITELCPDGVVLRNIGEMCDIKTGRGITRKDGSADGEFPIISGGKEPMGYYHKHNGEPNTVTISRVGANAGYVSFITQRFYLNDKCFSVIPHEKYKRCLDSKFLYEILKSLEKNITDMQSEGGVPTINTQKVSGINIPVPPLPVQEEIVRILDKFTTLEAELEAELEARKKQYNYYHNLLMKFDDSVTRRPLGELFPLIRNGFVGTVTPYFTTQEKGVRYLKGTNIHNGIISDNDIEYVTTEFHQKHLRTELKEDDILMVQSGHVGECAVVGKKYTGANCHALIVMSNGGTCDSKYVVYYFQTAAGKDKLKKITTGGTVKHILASAMKKYIIPVPSIDEQERIVAILDRFETLVTDISQGLPAEIAARRKQYEYYRNKLLTFKEKTS